MHILQATVRHDSDSDSDAGSAHGNDEFENVKIGDRNSDGPKPKILKKDQMNTFELRNIRCIYLSPNKLRHRLCSSQERKVLDDCKGDIQHQYTLERSHCITKNYQKYEQLHLLLNK